MIIDTHLHIGLNGWTDDSLIKYLDENEIAKAWILTWDEQNPIAPEYYIPLAIDEVSKAFKKYPDRIVPFYAPDPGRPDWKKKLSERLDEGFAGCGELKVPYNWDDSIMQPLLEFLNENKLPVIFHMERARKIFIARKELGADWIFKRLINERFNGKSANYILKLKNKTGIFKNYLNKRLVDFPGYLQDFSSLEMVLEKYDQIQFIAHGPDIWNNFSIPDADYLFLQKGAYTGKGKLWELLNLHENLYCDLSGLSGFSALNRNSGATKEFLNSFHNKLLFGTDNIKLGLKEFLDNLNLDSEIMDAIYSKNAAHILGK